VFIIVVVVVVVICVVVVVVFDVVGCLLQFHVRQYREVVANVFDDSEFGTIIADVIFQRKDTSLNETKNTSRGQFSS